MVTDTPLRKTTNSDSTLAKARRTSTVSLVPTTRTSVDASFNESSQSFAKTKSITTSNARTIMAPSRGLSSDQTTKDSTRSTTIEERTDEMATPSLDQASRTTVDEKRTETIATTSADQTTNDLSRTTTDETRTYRITISSKTTALAKLPKSTLTPSTSSDLTTKGLGERTTDPQRTTYDDTQNLETTLSSNESGNVRSFIKKKLWFTIKLNLQKTLWQSVVV